MPTISWSGSTSSPRRAAKLVAVAIVSVSDTRVMPNAATSSGTTSLASVQGMIGPGTPWGSAPTVATPSSARPRTAESDGRADHGDQDGGQRVVIAGQDEQDGQDRRARRSSVGGVRLVDSLDERLDLVEEAVGVGGEAEELRQLADDDRDRQAVHVADLHLLREQVGDEPELPEPEPDLDEPHEDGEHPGQGDRRPGSSPPSEQRRDRRQDQRRDRRVRAEHQHARGPEDARSRPGRRSSCRGRSPPAARPAPRRPCPAERGSPPARCRRRGPSRSHERS